MAFRNAVKRMYSTIKEVPTKRYEYIYGVSPHTKNFQKFRNDQNFFAELEVVYLRRAYDAVINRLNYTFAGIGYLLIVPINYRKYIMKKLQ